MLRRRGHRNQSRHRSGAVFICCTCMFNVNGYPFCVHIYHCIYLTVSADTERPEKKNLDSGQTPCLCCTCMFNVYGYPFCVHATVFTLPYMLRRKGLRNQSRLRSDAVFICCTCMFNVYGYPFCVRHCIYLTLSAEAERPEKSV